ncbi:hypothetical protein ACLVWU_12815 [Bdellovibrio sp. HCB290]|uniref:hypothetical protein n=1 Tax=Bdellovibrio sp. HCB290 TaxID=3394356 RepID=UPI0039B6B9CE
MKKTNAYISILSLAALSACAPQDMSFTASTLASSSPPGQSDTIIPSRGVNQNFDIRENSKIDVLFVVDNSGSMAEEQANMSSKISGFMNLVDHLDWRVALTTTDPRINTTDSNGGSSPWGDGQFRPMISGKRFMSKTDGTKDQAQAALAQAIMLGDKGNGDERPIYSISRAIERDVALPAADRFFRADSNLVVIIISDEDECSNGQCTTGFDVSKSQPANLVSLVRSKLGAEKVMMVDTIVKSPGDSSCTTSNQPAPILISLAQLTGGIVGSICATDYTAILKNAGDAAVSLTRAVSLSCKPIDADNDGKVDLVIKDSAGNTISSGYSVSGNIVTFNSSLANGSYKADFRCAM